MIKFWPLPRLGLLQQISLIFCILGVILGSGLIVTINIYEKQYIKQQLIEQNERVLSFLSAGSLNAVISEDRPVLETLVEQVLTTDPDIIKIILLNEVGKILVERGNLNGQGAEASISFSHDVVLAGETFGTIELYWGTLSFSEQVSQRTRPIIILATLIVLIMTGSFYVSIKYFIIKPISRINGKLLQLSDSTQIAPLNLPKAAAIEFGNLAESVNSLRQSQNHREQILADLEVAKDKAEASNEAKNKFLAVMSHEIRTPINGIMGMADMLKEGHITDEQDKYIDVIINSSENLMIIVDDILDFSRIEKNKFNLSINRFSFFELLGHLENEFSFEAKNKNLQFSIINLATKDLVLVGDEGHLKQVLINLLSNAFKFTSDGNVTLETDVKDISKNNVEICFQIKDTGVGISAENQKKIFEEFKQIDDGFDRCYMGLGLGLSLSQKIVEKMGGLITVKSREGIGSCFSFSVSMEKSKEIERHDIDLRTSDVVSVLSSMKNNGTKLNEEQNKKKVLLVEDCITNQEVVVAMLKNTRFKVDVVQNGKEALEYVKHHNQDNLHAILMDISTPEMDGITATQEIRILNDDISKVPIIALTAHAYNDEKDLFISSGMDDYLAKPVRKRQLLATLTRWVPQVH